MKRFLGTTFALICLGSVVHAERTQIGERIEARLETPHPYGLEDRAEPDLVWVRTLHHPQAVYIAPHFARFQLAEGDHVIVRSPDGKQVWRYTGLGRADQGLSATGFWSSHIKGDTAIVELYSRRATEAFGFVIDTFARGFTIKEIEEKNPGHGGPDPEAICGADDSEWAPCYAATEPQIYDQARAVTRLIISGSFGCTGWLVGCEGHLITNNHCISTASEANNTDYEFMAEGATCQTNCFGFGACPGTVEATAATLIQTNAALDYSLVLLPQNLSTEYGYLQLRAEGAELGERIYIPQHAAAWGKRIAIESTHPQDASGFCEVHDLNAPPCSGGPGDIGYFCDTQGGSSGSPVLAWSDKRVVALHHCANCPNRGLDITDVIANLGGNLPACALEQLAGTVVIDRQVFSCSDSIEITVTDDSLQGEGSVPVAVRSDSETQPETVVLQEIEAGVFHGAIPTTSGAASGSDGALTLTHDDEIRVEYIDADDGSGGIDVERSDTAEADCQGPSITKVDAGDVTGSAATITWDTDEPADSLVTHGVDTTGNGELVSGHSIRIRGLAECSTQTFSVTSADALGNSETADNAGLLFSIETGKDTQPEIDSVDTPLGIPDDSGSGAESSIIVTDDKPVIDVNVLVHLRHTFDGDLTLELVAPDGTVITLASHLGSTGEDYYGTLFDDEAALSITSGAAPFAGPYRPQEALRAADGLDAAGEWRFRAVDDDPGDAGVIESWTLILTYPPQVCGPSAVIGALTVEDDACASGNGADNTVWDSGEQVQFKLTVQNNGSEPLTDIALTVTPLAGAATMLVDHATIADLPIGASSATSAPHFLARLAAQAACGEALPFQVQIDSNEGSWTRTFTRTAGKPVQFHGLALSAGFEGGLPASWTVVDGAGDGKTWFADDHADAPGCSNIDPDPPIVGRWAAVDSDCAGHVAMNEELISPILNLGSSAAVTVAFDHYFNHYANELAEVDVRSSQTGGSWVTLAQYSADSVNSEHVALDATAWAAGATNVQFRWHYHNADFDWFWYVDNVAVHTLSGGSCIMNSCAQAASSPPPVPALTAHRDDAQGTRIVLDWDDQCLPAAANLLYGPLEQVGSYTISGSVCAISNPLSWDSVPGGSLWFLVASDNGLGVEGSWGAATSGERNGSGASGECGVIAKAPDGACP